MYRPKKLTYPYVLWHPNDDSQMLNYDTVYYFIRMVGVTPHILRYSFATHYYEVSKDIKLISELLGHASVAITSEYLCLGHDETMRKARQLFER